MMAKPINQPLYSAKKLSCDAPIPNVANIPANIGSPQQLITPNKASNGDITLAIIDQIVPDLPILILL
ncbi:hypothetical protein BatF92_13700 [Bacteroides thetaiotaomicron]|uniref:Uncharacterized protein n=2 Tax=Bacteroides TaxID=816 RepID=D6D3C1_9BACE|nr:hypothetical protein BatF92_13700 [Bacteroides thetaiotaomicron]CBK68923.1 hypothetical protein BXY_39930 [Bacteroides xylanisolvens XB1A]